MKKMALLAGLIASASLMSCTTAITAPQNGDMVSIWTVNRTGAPPFKRQLTEIPAADLAALELDSGPLETELVRVVDYRGKPPFRRRVMEVQVVDAASFEVEEVNTRRSGPRPFLKRHR